MGRTPRARATHGHGRRRRLWRTATLAATLAILVALTSCASNDETKDKPSDPVLAALKADPMGTSEPPGFTLVDSMETASAGRDIATGKSTQAAWTRDFRSTAKSKNSVAALKDLATTAEREGWEVGYTGATDMSATKTIAGEPAVLYAAIEPVSSDPLDGSEEYALQVALRS